MNPSPGWVLQVNLGHRLPPGHEQSGLRPVLVIGVPALAGKPRFPLLIVVPLTTFRQQKWALASPVLYPTLPSGVGALQMDSIVLLDQIQVIDANRVVIKIGFLSDSEFKPILNSLKVVLGFRPKASSLPQKQD